MNRPADLQEWALAAALLIMVMLGTLTAGSAANSTISRDGNTFYLTFRNGDEAVQYEYTPGQGSPDVRGTFQELRVHIDNSYYFYPSNVGGPIVDLNGVEYFPWSAQGPDKEMIGLPGLSDNGTPDDPSDDFVTASFRWTKATDSVEFTYRLSIRDTTLYIEMSSNQAKVVCWTSDRTEDQTPGDPSGDPPMDLYVIPSLTYPIAVVRHPLHPVFAALTFDTSRSQATRIDNSYARYDAGSIYIGQSAIYEKNTIGSRSLSDECLSITVSSEVKDLFAPLPPWTRISPWREDLSRRVVYDNWLGQDWERDTTADLRRMHDHGLRDLVMILHIWQRWGYDVKLPDHLPPNPAYGGESALRNMIATATKLGFRVALHENYTDNYPDAPSYTPSLNALNADGSFVKAWFNSSTGIQSFALKSTRALDVMKTNAPTIKDFGVTAGFVDVLSAVYFGGQVDHDATAPGASKGRQVIEDFTSIMDYARGIYEGPFLGEGGGQALWAGIADGVEGEITRLIPFETVPWVDYPPVVDFDLFGIHPRMVNHGSGYHNRFFWGLPFESSHYNTARATTIAFGRVGFIDTTGEGRFNLLEAVREYYLMRPLQDLLALATPLSIFYEKDGAYRTCSQAILDGDAWRVRVEWSNGAMVWVNRGPQEWTVAPGNGHEYALAPVDGWLVWHPGTEPLIAYSTTMTDGSRVDSVVSEDLTFGYVGAPRNLGAMALSARRLWGVRDVHACGLASDDILDVPVLTTSQRGSSNLEWQDSGRCIYRFSESAANTTTVRFNDAPLHWRTAGGQLKTSKIEIWRLNSDGSRLSRMDWTPIDDSRTLSWTALHEVDYELTGPSNSLSTSVSSSWMLY